MEENNYTVYMHKNKINGKVYIGITSQYPVKRRWKKGSCYKSCKKFYRAIKKYGWDNFEHIILFKNMTKKEVCEKEIELIKKYNSIKNGYNILKGGNLSNKGISFSEKHKRKIGEANKGEKNGMFGKKQSEKVKKINSEKSKKQWQNVEFRNKMSKIMKYEKNHFKKVECIETKEIFFSMHEASRKYNIIVQNISKCCKGERKTCGGYHWRYYEE